MIPKAWRICVLQVLWKISLLNSCITKRGHLIGDVRIQVSYLFYPLEKFWTFFLFHNRIVNFNRTTKLITTENVHFYHRITCFFFVMNNIRGIFTCIFSLMPWFLILQIIWLRRYCSCHTSWEIYIRYVCEKLFKVLSCFIV